MTDKLTFSFQGAVKVRIGNTDIDLEQATEEFQYEGRNSAKKDALRGFEAGNGVFFRLKKHLDGKVYVIIYGPPEQLAKYQFSVKGGDLSRARFAQGEFRKSFQSRDISLAGRDLGPADLGQSMSRLGLSAYARESSDVAQPSIANPSEFHQRPLAEASITMPRTGFDNLGNTCYLNATLKTMISGMGPSLVNMLKAQEGRHPFDFAVGNAKPLDEIRRTLIALASAAGDPAQQHEVSRQLKALVNQLNDNALNALSDEADRHCTKLSQRLSTTQDPLVNAEEDLQLAKVALRLLEEGRPYKAVLDSLSKEASAVKGYQTSEEFNAFIQQQSSVIEQLQAAHQANLEGLAKDAQQAGYASFTEQLRTLAATSKAGKFVDTLNSQQDATEFGSWLREIMSLTPAHEQFTRRKQLVNVWSERGNGPGEQGWTLPLNPRQSAESLQTLVSREFTTSTVELNRAGGVASQTLVIEADLGALTRLTVSIDGRDAFGTRVRLDTLDFETPVTIPIVDSRSGDIRRVVFRARDVIFHEGDEGGGHYFAYIREGGNWFRHDDASPVSVRPLPDLTKAQPRTITFEVAGIL